MSIRKVALIALVSALLSLVMPLWNAAQTIIEVGSEHPALKWSTIPMTLLIVLLAAIMPLFYFGVYRSPSPLRFSRRFRPWISAAVIVSAWITFVAFKQLLGGFGGGHKSVTAMGTGWNIGQTVALFGPISDLTYLLLLIAFFQHANDESKEVQSSSALLFVGTKVAVVVWSVVLAIGVIRLLFTPYTFSQLRNYAAQMGRRSPELWDLMKDSLIFLINQGILIVAPFIVNRDILKRRVDAAAPTADDATPVS